MGCATYKRYALPEMGGTEILLKQQAKDPDFIAAGYVKLTNSPFSYLPDGHHDTSAVSDVEKYRAWAYHAEQNIDDVEIFVRCTQNMNALSVKPSKQQNRKTEKR